jgi:hypothetical protein
VATLVFNWTSPLKGKLFLVKISLLMNEVMQLKLLFSAIMRYITE